METKVKTVKNQTFYKVDMSKEFIEVTVNQKAYSLQSYGKIAEMLQDLINKPEWFKHYEVKSVMNNGYQLAVVYRFQNIETSLTRLVTPFLPFGLFNRKGNRKIVCFDIKTGKPVTKTLTKRMVETYIRGLIIQAFNQRNFLG
jgi:hypothetical protein